MSSLNVFTTIVKRYRVPIICIILLIPELDADETKQFEYTITPTKPMTQIRNRHAAVPLEENKVGLFGGLKNKTIEIFNYKTLTFSSIDHNRHYSDFNAVSIGNHKVLLVKGNQDYVYDFGLSQFIPTKNSYNKESVVRNVNIIPLENGKLFLYGGLDADFNPINKFALFDPDKLEFKEIGKLILPRIDATVAKITENQILVTGGTLFNKNRGSKISGSNSVEIFNLDTGKSTINPHTLNIPRQYHAAVSLPNGKVLIAGGSKSDNKGYSSAIREVEMYDPEKGDFTIVGSLAIGRYQQLQTALLPSGRVAFFGGADDIRVVEVFCSKKLKFILANQLQINARSSGFTSTFITNQDILIAGGRVNSGPEQLKEAEVFTEKEVLLENDNYNREAQLEKLFAQLKDKNYSLRKKAIQELIDYGPGISAEVTKLLQSEDSGVRRIARRILKEFEDQRKLPNWCVELWNKDKKLSELSFTDYKCTWFKKPDSRIQSLKGAVNKHNPTTMIVRFPNSYSYEVKVKLFNMCGWSDFPIIKLGEPLITKK